jgi:hypothetical protein
MSTIYQTDPLYGQEGPIQIPTIPTCRATAPFHHTFNFKYQVLRTYPGVVQVFKRCQSLHYPRRLLSAMVLSSIQRSWSSSEVSVTPRASPLDISIGANSSWDWNTPYWQAVWSCKGFVHSTELRFPPSHHSSKFLMALITDSRILVYFLSWYNDLLIKGLIQNLNLLIN